MGTDISDTAGMLKKFRIVATFSDGEIMKASDIVATDNFDAFHKFSQLQEYIDRVVGMNKKLSQYSISEME